MQCPLVNGTAKRTMANGFLQETKMPVSQYEKFADQFNPVKFDADEWVKLAKDAGMKYIVITSKHHDGFDMFPSKLTDWDIERTPFQTRSAQRTGRRLQKSKALNCAFIIRLWTGIIPIGAAPRVERYGTLARPIWIDIRLT